MAVKPSLPLHDLLVAAGSAAADVRGGATDPAVIGESSSAEAASRHAAFLGELRQFAAPMSGDRGARWLLASEDARHVAVVLLGAALVGARVVLPPNLQPGTLAELKRRCDRVIGAGRDGDGLQAEPASLQQRSSAGSGVAIDRDAALVEIYTSGTSGSGKVVLKALRHLEDEVVELERQFGAALDADAVVLATVPAHHLYGLLFRVLWPLASGRPFARTSFLLPEELIVQVSRMPRSIVVSSPAHLRRLAGSSRLAAQASRIVEIFSSGGPLETATALALQQSIGRAPVEIFGSTETGGVAYRRACAAAPNPSWTPMLPVSVVIDAESRLVVTSPFVSSEDGSTAVPASFRMADRAAQGGAGFRLLGRSDRVAKIGEKTLALPEIEDWLRAHEHVADVAAAVYESRGGSRLGAVVVLAPGGKHLLAAQGRRATTRMLAAHVAERWDPVAVPKRWRFADALPFDARGKLVAAEVEARLARPAGDVVEPVLLHEESGPGRYRGEFVVPCDLAYLEGHYEAFPLVPGAVQVHWVMAALARAMGRPVAVRAMEAIKFRNVLRPAQVFTLELSVEGSRAQFVLRHAERVFASGRVVIADDAGEPS
ncbi:MAG TPA: AMP-binding protein [Candidatus Binatia bacterium]|jgi:acyl-coenzyme A synthetase/AMP-(fatty) acid ligase